VRSRSIPRKTYDDQAELTEAYYAAEQERIPVSFRR
jgi:hypothetical protein